MTADAPVDDGLVAEQLHDFHAYRHGVLCGGARHEVQGLRPHADDELAAGGTGGLEHEIARVHAAARRGGAEQVHRGLPMNPATNTFAGRR